MKPSCTWPSFNVFSTTEKQAVSLTPLFSALERAEEGIHRGLILEPPVGCWGFHSSGLLPRRGGVGRSEGGGVRSCQLDGVGFFL